MCRMCRGHTQHRRRTTANGGRGDGAPPLLLAPRARAYLGVFADGPGVLALADQAVALFPRGVQLGQACYRRHGGRGPTPCGPRPPSLRASVPSSRRWHRPGFARRVRVCACPVSGGSDAWRPKATTRRRGQPTANEARRGRQLRCAHLTRARLASTGSRRVAANNSARARRAAGWQHSTRGAPPLTRPPPPPPPTTGGSVSRVYVCACVREQRCVCVT